MKNKALKNILLFIVIVIADFLIIQGARMVTPLIVPLRLGIIFAVFAVSIWVYFLLINPVNLIRAGLVLGVAACVTSLIESLIMHTWFIPGGFRPIHLVPASFALVLPVLIAGILHWYRKGKSAAQK